MTTGSTDGTGLIKSVTTGDGELLLYQANHYTAWIQSDLAVRRNEVR